MKESRMLARSAYRLAMNAPRPGAAMSANAKSRNSVRCAKLKPLLEPISRPVALAREWGLYASVILILPSVAHATPGTVGFADKLKGMLWTAYGPLLKWGALVLLVVVVVMPLLTFVRKLLR